MTLTDILSGAVPPAPKPKAKKNKARTKAATKARQKAYDQAVRLIVKPLKDIRAHWFTSAEDIAGCLNMLGIPAPHEIIWTKSSVLRALSRLRRLGLEPKKDLPGNPLDPLNGGYLDLTKPAHLKLFLEMQAKAKADQLAGTTPPEAPPLKPVYGSTTSI
jgi:hypothetical protein